MTRETIPDGRHSLLGSWPRAVYGATPLFEVQSAPFNPSALPSDTLFPLQTNLVHPADEAIPSSNINITSVWAKGVSGKGVTIGVFDTQMDTNHEDLRTNIDRAKNLAGKFAVSKETNSTGAEHATSVAGLIAAARNDVGVVGVAYGGTIIPIDLFGAATKPGGMWEALDRQSKFDVTNHSWAFTGAFVEDASDTSTKQKLGGFSKAAAEGRNELGTVAIVAAGNYREHGLSTETNGMTVDRHLLVVGAADWTGEVAYYSSPGASVLVVAPSNSDGSGVMTTDVTGVAGYSAGNYTDSFGGTSAATALVSGVVAVVLEANPNLGWRDVQSILALSARHTGSGAASTPFRSDETWKFNHAAIWNGGGVHFSNDYGFGLVDAGAAVRLAESWTFSSPIAHTSHNENHITAKAKGAWSVNEGATATICLKVNRDQSVEAAVLTLPNLKSQRAEELVVEVTSPGGTVSRLLTGNISNPAAISDGWQLMSRQFLGEDARGIWTVRISGDADLSKVKLDLYGSKPESGVYYYTDEYDQFWTPERSLLSDPGKRIAINAAAVTTPVTVNLATGDVIIAHRSVTLDGGTSVGTLSTGDAADTVSAGSAPLRLFAGAGDDTVRGGPKADTLILGDGNDRVDGGPRSDILAGGAGIDTVAYQSAPRGIRVDLALSKPQDTRGPGKDTIRGFENVEGSEFDDRIRGNEYDNVLSGGGGDDALIGGDGNDVLIGGSEADTIKGSGGADVLDGGLGKDSLIGGPGSDVFWVQPSAGADLIVDFDPNTDTLRFDKAAFGLSHLKGSQFPVYFVGDLASSTPGTTPCFEYSEQTGVLSWDADGKGPSPLVAIAAFKNRPHLSATDFDLL